MGWNHLPAHTKVSPALSAFENRLKQVEIHCMCSSLHHSTGTTYLYSYHSFIIFSRV